MPCKIQENKSAVAPIRVKKGHSYNINRACYKILCIVSLIALICTSYLLSTVPEGKSAN